MDALNLILGQADGDDVNMPKAMWSIAEVERDTGIGKDTLRVWERRYGFPVPERDASGERCYPPSQVQRLRLIKRLLDTGSRPGKVVGLDEATLQGMMSGAQSTDSPGALPAGALSEEPWLKWLADHRNDEVRLALLRRIERDGLAHCVQHCVAPLCIAVGDAWLRGELSVYHEHLFTETLQGVLREAIAAVDASTHKPSAPRVLLTTTPGEQHGLGLLMAECFFALEGCERLSLGCCTPVADIVLAARRTEVDVLALSFSVHSTRRDVLEALRQVVLQLPPHVQIWAGGSGAGQIRRGKPGRVSIMRHASDVPRQVEIWREQMARLRGV